MPRKRTLLREPVNLFEVGAQLVEAKTLITQQVLDAARDQGLNVVDAERKAATLFYKAIGHTTPKKGYSQATTAQYVRVYERFADSKLRTKIEGLFTASELALLASYSDDDLFYLGSAKEVTPEMARDQLGEILKAARCVP
ncbi:hypothetical protein BRCH_01566c [Candidatus Burkholderia brachyanthoides]|nr:hypothetical protein BRCH_01566c [Candidatus Burkholderia brachyanthoides]